MDQAKKAVAEGADYLGSGAMFGSSTKTEAKPMTLAQFAEIRKAVDVPIVLIGGMMPEISGNWQVPGAQGRGRCFGNFCSGRCGRGGQSVKAAVSGGISGVNKR